MRVVIQRTKTAEVRIGSKLHEQIDSGMLILLGIEEADTSEDSDWLIRKICQLRIFNDHEGKMNLSLQETKGSFLVVSQFTLFASTKKGNRPSYIRAARPEIAIPLYEAFTRQLEVESGLQVKTGVFGAHMEISLVNDGPVTIIIDSKNRE